MATLSELRENPQALRRFFIFGAVLLAALGWLLLPSMLPHHSADAHVSKHPQDHTQTAPINNPAPIAGGKSPIAGDPAPVSGPAPVAAPDPYGKLLGKWAGEAMISGKRGVCSLQLEVSKDAVSPASFKGYSKLSCVPSMLEILATSEPGKKLTPAQALDKWSKLSTPTSASFTGEAQAGAIEFKAVDNIGVTENANNCEMLSLTLREFGGGGVSVKWRETEKGNCRGGEMTMSRK